jgi:hypothetical protein
MRSHLAVAIAFLLVAAPSFAQPSPPPQGSPGAMAPMARPPATPEMKEARHAMCQACAADYKSLCGDVEMGGGKIMQCLKSHRTQLSAECKDAWGKLRAARQSSGR